MTPEKLAALNIAEGHVETTIEHEVEVLTDLGKEVHAQRLQDMWAVIVAGLSELKQENAAYMKFADSINEIRKGRA